MGKLKQNKGGAGKPDKIKKEKAIKVEPKIEHADDDDDAPATIPIARKDDGPVTAKKGKKKDKKGAKVAAGGDVKPKKVKKGGVEKPKDPKVKLSKKLKGLKKSVLVKESSQPTKIAEAPEILASKAAITEAVVALRKAVEEESKSKNKLFAKDFRYCIQICQMKVPKAPTRQVRLDLAHSLYDDTDEVCLFVRDKEKGKKADPEQTALQYEQLFREKKIDFINKILPLAELKQNYGSFEMKKKLEQTYDVFLSDAIISSYVFGLVGKAFIEKRKTAIPVKLKNVDPDKWKVTLQKALLKTVYKQTPKGPTIAIPVATHKLSVEQFVDNIEAVLNQLKTQFPGGWLNIRNIYLKPMEHSKVSLPIYISKININEVPVPVIVGPKARHVIKMAEKLAEESNKFTVDEKGVLEKKKPKKAENGEAVKTEKKPKVIKQEETPEEDDDDEEEEDDDLDESAELEAEGSDNEVDEDEEEDDDDDEVPQAVPQKRKAAPLAAVQQKKKQKGDNAPKAESKKQKKGPAPATNPKQKPAKKENVSPVSQGKKDKKQFNKKNTNTMKKFKPKA